MPPSPIPLSLAAIPRAARSLIAAVVSGRQPPVSWSNPTPAEA